jgi:hypothetical protein
MKKDKKTQSQLVIDGVDRDTRKNILRLDQKLKGLRAEIEAQLQNPLMYDGEDRESFFEKLSVVSKEIDDAINGIDTLVQLVSGEDKDVVEAFFQGEEMRDFSTMIAENLDKLTEIKKNL